MPEQNQPWTIEQVARFDHQVTGVSVSEDGRIFVNFPRWTGDSAVSVPELNKDGTLRPYPHGRWNAWCNARKDELAARRAAPLASLAEVPGRVPRVCLTDFLPKAARPSHRRRPVSKSVA